MSEQINRARSDLKNQFEAKMEYLESLEELSNSSAYRCEDGDWEFLEKFGILFKKYFSHLNDTHLKEASVDLLKKWSAKLDNWRDSERISYCNAFQKILVHLSEDQQSTEKNRTMVNLTLEKKLKNLELLVKQYCKNDEKLSSSFPETELQEFLSNEFEPSLNKLLDKITNITEFVLKYIRYFKDKEFIEAMDQCLSAFYKTVFDYTSEDVNKDHLASNYETLKILLFVSTERDLLDDF
jgi:hypothetical protein